MIRCPGCGKVFDLPASAQRDPHLRLFCDACRRLFSVAEVSQVLVVHEDADTYEVVSRIVADTGHLAAHVPDGKRALELCAVTTLPLVLVDVASRGIYAYELVRLLKELPAGHAPFIVLLASVYDKTAYKRAPTTLYGADDYLEQHHLPDKLPLIVGKVFKSGVAALPLDALVERRQVLRQAAAEDLHGGSIEVLSQQARRLARRVLLDISLYQGDVWAEGLRNGDLLQRLKKPLEDARQFLWERLPPPLRDSGAPDFIDEALRALLAEQAGHR